MSGDVDYAEGWSRQTIAWMLGWQHATDLTPRINALCAALTSDNRIEADPGPTARIGAARDVDGCIRAPSAGDESISSVRLTWKPGALPANRLWQMQPSRSQKRWGLSFPEAPLAVPRLPGPISRRREPPSNRPSLRALDAIAASPPQPARITRSQRTEDRRHEVGVDSKYLPDLYLHCRRRRREQSSLGPGHTPRSP